jgi:hypothetical protein
VEVKNTPPKFYADSVKETLGSRKCIWEDNINMVRKETECDVLECIKLAPSGI